MTIVTISSLEQAKVEMSQFMTGDRKLIGVGVLLPDNASRRSMKVALVDVTEEYNRGLLDLSNLMLINSFIHSHQEELTKQIELIDVNPLQAAASC